MSWLSKFGRWIDPTNKNGGVASALRELDPTRKASAMAGIGRALDVTNQNSLAGMIAPYAVGAIPGIGMPLAMGLGAGLRASQAVGRGDYGDIVGDALKGAGQAGMVQGIAQTAMPGTFAAKAPTLAPVPGSPSSFPAGPRLDVPLNNPSFSGLTGTVAQETAPALSSTAQSLGPSAGHSALSGIGSFLTRQPTTIPSILSAGANIYGASQVGAAEDARLKMEQEQYDEEEKKRANRIGFDAWRAQRTV